MKPRIYKVPFYVITEELADYFCEDSGFVVVKKNIFGSNKEIITGFNNFYNVDYIDYDNSNNRLCGKQKLNYNTDYYWKTKEHGFALALQTSDFKDKNLATLKDIEEWEQNFETSEFYKYYQQMHIFDKDEKKAIRDKVKSISKRRFDGKF